MYICIYICICAYVGYKLEYLPIDVIYWRHHLRYTGKLEV